MESNGPEDTEGEKPNQVNGFLLVITDGEVLVVLKGFWMGF